MRKCIGVAWIAGILVLLYAALGFVLAPRLIEDRLIEAARRHGIEAQVETVRANPFLLTLSLERVALRDPNRRARATANRATLDLAWASLWQQAWIVDRATLEQPEVELTLGPDREPRPETSPRQKTPDGQETLTPILVEQFAVSGGSVHLIDRTREVPAELRLDALEIELTGLSTRADAPGQYEFAARVAGGGTIAAHGTVSVAPFTARGQLAIADVPVSTVWQFAAPKADAAAGVLQAAATFAYDDGRLVLSDVSIEGGKIAYADIELPHLTLQSPKLTLPSDKALEITAKAQVNPGGTVAANGSVVLQPFGADLQLELTGIALPQAQRWLPESVTVNIASGVLSARGRLRVHEGDGPRATYEGAVAVQDARFEERDSGDLLLGWQRLETNEATLHLAPSSVEVGEITAHAPAGRLIIEEDGRVNVAEVFKEKAATEKDVAFHAAVRQLRIEKGTLEFADRSLETDFAVTIRELAGTVNAFSTAGGDPARVQLAGRVAKQGSARIEGVVNFGAPKSLTNVHATFRNLPLAALTPYIVKFAGYRVESGRLSAELRYRVRDGRLVGVNQLVFENLQLGEKVQTAGALDIPLELAIALLADASGRIDLDIPVRGNLNDPQFDLGGLIARAAGNVIGRIVSAPFRALAALFGDGGMDLNQVPFEPGSAILTPRGEQNVERVAKALAQRPGLSVSVRGGYDPERDRKAPIERSAGAAPVEPKAGEMLARARGETVRAALVEHGVNPSRVQLLAPKGGGVDTKGVTTELALSAGAPMPPAPEPRPAARDDRGTVRQVQRKLNAADFDAGPVDGILGPMTRDALREFQEAHGLEVTGRPDERTLIALGIESEPSISTR